MVGQLSFSCFVKKLRIREVLHADYAAAPQIFQMLTLAIVFQPSGGKGRIHMYNFNLKNLYSVCLELHFIKIFVCVNSIINFHEKSF